MFADLHLHSTFSDGTDTPLELCSLAKTNNVKVISITDHDAVGALKEIQYVIPEDIKVISGVEISTIYKRRYLHVLGYYIDIFDKQLENFIARISMEKTENTRVNFENAKSKGVFDYKWERVLELNAEQPRISGVHVVKAMQIDQYTIPNMKLWDMFHLFFWAEGQEFIETETTSGYDAIDIIKQIGGIPIIAHPKSIGNDDIVIDLLRYGAQGLEVFHPVHSIKETEKYKQIAEENKKYITGGTDWHGKNNGAEVTHFGMTGLEHGNYEILKIRNLPL
jgi:predicted metal-dependent phosphoesterase TrpH